jgi:hypothetical protein
MSAESLKFPESLTEEERNQAQEWFDSRPEVIKAMVRKWPYWNHYGIPPHKDHYTIQGYNEDGTLRLIRWCHLTQEPRWHVFDVDPNTLVLRMEAK